MNWKRRRVSATASRVTAATTQYYTHNWEIQHRNDDAKDNAKPPTTANQNYPLQFIRRRKRWQISDSMWATKIVFGIFRGSRSLRPEEKCKIWIRKSNRRGGRARRAGTQSTVDRHEYIDGMSGAKSRNAAKIKRKKPIHFTTLMKFGLRCTWCVCVEVEVDCWCDYGLPRKHSRFGSNPKRRNCFCIYLFAAVGRLAKVRSKCDGMTTHKSNGTQDATKWNTRIRSQSIFFGSWISCAANDFNQRLWKGYKEYCLWCSSSSSRSWFTNSQLLHVTKSNIVVDTLMNSCDRKSCHTAQWLPHWCSLFTVQWLIGARVRQHNEEEI